MTGPGADVTVDPQRRLVRVRDPLLRTGSGAPGNRRWPREPLVSRVFSCRHAAEMRLDGRAATAEIRLRDDAPLAEAVRDLARAVRAGGDPGDRHPPVLPAVPADCFARSAVTVWRVGDRLTTWRITAGPEGFVRLHHPRLRRDRVLARGVERLALALPGVLDARLAGAGADLLVRLAPETCDGDTLVALLQHAVDERVGVPPGSSPWQMCGTSTSLAVAAAADFALPALAPVSALLLVGTNLRTLGTAVGDLARRRIGLPTVSAAIILGTLATGQFLAAGIMAWSLDFWRRRHRRDLETERLLLLEDAVPQVAAAAVTAPDGGTDLRLVETLGPGARVPLERGDVVPADGRVAAGGGVVDDRSVSGVSGARAVAVGDPLAAGTVLLGGSLVLTVDRPFAESRLARIGFHLAAATAAPPGRFAVTRAAERFGERFVAPTLATAGLGLLAGDVATAVAILRPDYASAEGMAVSFADLDAVARGLAAGCVLTRPAALDAVIGVDTVVVIVHPGLHRRGLQVSRVVTGAVVGDASQAEAIRWAASLARHLADPRREALEALALARGCALVDVVPEAFGDAQGLGLALERGPRALRLVETRDQPAAAWRPLVLEVDGRVAATFEFATTAGRAAAAAIDRLRGPAGLQVLLAADALPAGSDAEARPDLEALARDLHCDGVVAPGPGGLAGGVRDLVRSGRRVACIGPLESVAAMEDAATVTIGLGGGDIGREPVVDIVCLADDLGCLGELLTAAADRRARRAVSRRLSILPNVACVAGAFAFGFTSLVTAVITNLGTMGTYHLASRTLEHARRRHWLRHRAVARRRLPWGRI